ncbi:MAG: plasmid pRiA4b ORF-3 family protein, partial [Terriglobales bacterium]
QGLGAGIIDENRTRLGDVICAPGTRLLYEYDFGDGWQHELLLEEVLLGDESFRQICVAGERNCPPEDCGGPPGFAELLTALQDSSHPEHDSLSEWVGENFVPEYFAADEINRKLSRRKH